MNNSRSEFERHNFPTTKAEAEKCYPSDLVVYPSLESNHIAV
jgi:hypothetical protein